MKRTGEKKQIVYAVLTVFLWATMAPAVKLMQDSVPTTEVLFLAGVFSVVFLLGRLIANGKVKEYRTFGAQNYKVVLGLGFLGFFVYEFLYYFGIAQLTIALKQAGRKANDVTFSKAKLERDDGRWIYDIEFYVTGQNEYDYEIDATTGNILDYEVEGWELDD